MKRILVLVCLIYFSKGKVAYMLILIVVSQTVKEFSKSKKMLVLRYTEIVFVVFFIHSINSTCKMWFYIERGFRAPIYSGHETNTTQSQQIIWYEYVITPLSMKLFLLSVSVKFFTKISLMIYLIFQHHFALINSVIKSF